MNTSSTIFPSFKGNERKRGRKSCSRPSPAQRRRGTSGMKRGREGEGTISQTVLKNGGRRGREFHHTTDNSRLCHSPPLRPPASRFERCRRRRPTQRVRVKQLLFGTLGKPAEKKGNPWRAPLLHQSRCSSNTGCSAGDFIGSDSDLSKTQAFST